MNEANGAAGTSGASGVEAGKSAGRASKELTVYLASDRSRRLTWMLSGCAIGGLLLWKFGTVAAALGVILVVVGLYHTWFFVQSLLHEPGSVVITRSKTTLPRGLSRGAPEQIDSSALSAAYFLRHAVPWSKSAPVLVIEAGERAFLLPRDWFASEADQRRIMHAVLPLVEGRAAEGAIVASTEPAAAAGSAAE